jgi:hypothetical protein
VADHTTTLTIFAAITAACSMVGALAQLLIVIRSARGHDPERADVARKEKAPRPKPGRSRLRTKSVA